MVVQTMTTKDAKKINLKFNSYGVTHVGNVRKLNEDAFLERPEIGLWAVADGMGGHDSGDMASNMIVSDLKRIHQGLKLNRIIDDIEDKLINVNRKLIEKSSQSIKKSTIGSTVVSMVVYENYCVYLWVGDSRLYRLQNKNLKQLTRDHSQVQIYIDNGIIDEKEAELHPHRNMITRAIGAMDELYVDMDIQIISPNDRYLLCSDGLNRHLKDSEIEEIMNKGDSSEKTCNTLIDMVLDRGAEDNVTAIIVDVT